MLGLGVTPIAGLPFLVQRREGILFRIARLDLSLTLRLFLWQLRFLCQWKGDILLLARSAAL